MDGRNIVVVVWSSKGGVVDSRQQEERQTQTGWKKLVWI